MQSRSRMPSRLVLSKRRRARWMALLPMLAMGMALALAGAPAQAVIDEDVLQYQFEAVQVPAAPEGAPTDGSVTVGCQGSSCRLIHLSAAYEVEVGAPTFTVPGELVYSTEGRGDCDSVVIPPYSVALTFTATGVSGTVESFSRTVDCGDGSSISAEPSTTALAAGVLTVGACYFAPAGCDVGAGGTEAATDRIDVVYDVTVEVRTIDETGTVTVDRVMDTTMALECDATGCVPLDTRFFHAPHEQAVVTVPGGYDVQVPASGDLCGGDYSQGFTASLAFTATGVTGFVRDDPMLSDCGGGTSSLFGSELVILQSALVDGDCWFTAAGCAAPAANAPGSSQPAEPEGAVQPAGTAADDGGGAAGTSSRLASGDPAAPSVLSALATPAEAGIAPQQLALAALLTVILVLLMTFPTSLLNSAIDEASEKVAAWRGRRGAAAPPKWRGSWWWALIGVLAAAIISAFVDPQFGVNPGSLRVLLSIALGFAVDVVLGWVVLQWVMRRLAPEASRSFSFKPLTLLIVVAAVVFTRVTGFEPGIVFGLVAGLGFATTLGIAAKARTTLVPLAYAFGLGIVAWLVYGLVAERSGESIAMTLLVETLSSLTVGGLVALPLALVPVKGLSGHTVWQSSRRLWAVSYGIGLFAFFIVLMPMPFSWAEVGWALWAWIGVYVAYAAVAVAAWLLVRQPWKQDPQQPAQQSPATVPAAAGADGEAEPVRAPQQGAVP